jgi:hypothetical protein
MGAQEIGEPVSRPRRDPPRMTPAPPAVDHDLAGLRAVFVGIFVARDLHELAELVRGEAGRLAGDPGIGDKAAALAAWASGLPILSDIGPDGRTLAERALRNRRILATVPPVRDRGIRAVDPGA